MGCFPLAPRVARELQRPLSMTTAANAIFKGLFTDALSCTRCGSQNVFPAPGPFGALAGIVGLARHLCRPCGRPFWAKADAEYVDSGETEPETVGELLAEPAEPAAFDLDVSQPEPEPVDLAALDAEFARRCAATRRPRRRRRRRSAVATG